MPLDNNLVGRMTKLKARLIKLPTSFGVPQYRNVAIRTKTQVTLPSGMFSNTLTDTLIMPKPKVMNVPWKMVGLEASDNVVVGVNDWKIEIVRTLDFPSVKDIEFIIVDPVFNELNQIIDGLKCKVIQVSENDIVDWNLVVRHYKDSYTITPANTVQMEVEGNGN